MYEKEITQALGNVAYTVLDLDILVMKARQNRMATHSLQLNAKFCAEAQAMLLIAEHSIRNARQFLEALHAKSIPISQKSAEIFTFPSK